MSNNYFNYNIDKAVVSKIKPKNKHNKPVLGGSYFSDCFSNIYIVARKKSGKTTVIANILKKCASKNTKIIFFVPTIHKDSTYEAITELLDKKGVSYIENTHFITPEKENLIETFINEQSHREALNSEEELTFEPIKKNLIKPDEATLNNSSFMRWTVNPEPEKKEIIINEQPQIKKKKNSKYEYPEYIFILDDLGADSRHRSVYQLLSKNRHYKCKVIISSQYIHNLDKQAILNVDYILLFSGLNKDKLEMLYERLEPPFTYEEFQNYYDEATKEKFSFMYYHRETDEIRKKFNKRLREPK